MGVGGLLFLNPSPDLRRGQAAANLCRPWREAPGCRELSFALGICSQLKCECPRECMRNGLVGWFRFTPRLRRCIRDSSDPLRKGGCRADEGHLRWLAGQEAGDDGRKTLSPPSLARPCPHPPGMCSCFSPSWLSLGGPVHAQKVPGDQPANSACFVGTSQGNVAVLALGFKLFVCVSRLREAARRHQRLLSHSNSVTSRNVRWWEETKARLPGATRHNGAEGTQALWFRLRRPVLAGSLPRGSCGELAWWGALVARVARMDHF